MADNAKRHKVGLGLVPQADAPSNPLDGDMFCADGTGALSENLYVRLNGAWEATTGTFPTEPVTVTGSWTTNTTYSAERRRVGDHYHYDILVTLSGAPNSATLTINLDGGVTIDTGKLTSPTTNSTLSGSTCDLVDNPTISYAGIVTYNSTTSVRPKFIAYNAGFPNAVVQGSITETSPFTFGSGDIVHLTFSVPIVGL